MSLIGRSTVLRATTAALRQDVCCLRYSALVRRVALPVQARQASSSSSTSASTSFSSLRDHPPPPSGTPRVRTALAVLLAVALITTGAGIYVYYGSFSTWPEEVREDLRGAIKAKDQQNWIKAEKLFRQAIETAISLPAEKLGGKDVALLKISGIQIAFASAMEQSGDLRKAYTIYDEAWREVKEKGKSVEERMRAVALAQRCGDLARIEEVTGDKATAIAKAEEHLRWSVEELIHLAVPDDRRREVLGGRQDALMLGDLPLPTWISRTSLGASLEALGQVYAAQGKASHAVPLYIQSIELVMPSDKTKRTHDPTVAERCRAGILMNNLASLLVDAVEKGERPKVDDAQAWATRGLDIVTFALRGTGWDMKGGQGFKNVEGGGQDDPRTIEIKGTCWTAEVALLINLGELARLKKDDCKARDIFQRAYVRADMYGMREARSRCAQALSELERTTSKK